jgi:hypothetical protein
MRGGEEHPVIFNDKVKVAEMGGTKTRLNSTDTIGRQKSVRNQT